MDNLYVEAGNELPLLETPVAATVRDTWRDVVTLNVTLFAVWPFFYMTRWPWTCESLKTGTRVKSLKPHELLSSSEFVNTGNTAVKWSSLCQWALCGTAGINGEFPSCATKAYLQNVYVLWHIKSWGAGLYQHGLVCLSRNVLCAGALCLLGSALLPWYVITVQAAGMARLVVHVNTEERPFCF